MLARTPSHRASLLAAAIAGSLLLTACGSSSASSAAGGSAAAGTAVSSSASSAVAMAGRPTVFAAASLAKVLPQIDPSARYTFGGSGALETQIEQGAPADVFVSAALEQAQALYAKGLVERPQEFASNRLVMIVPAADPAHITSLADITRPGVKLVICNATVPCGDYARSAFAALGITAQAMRNVVSQTTDVTQTVAEVATGQADAGFVYITDALAAAGKVKAIALPPRARPRSGDYVAVVKAAARKQVAAAFVAMLLSSRGRSLLGKDGFGRP
jgi:molybdate transport system substrate-binding protein